MEDLTRLGSEGENPASRDLDRLDTLSLVRVMNEEDRGVALAVGRVLPEIAAVIDAAAERIARGGHLHYFGAGTSGRLGILDAVECPPTFGVKPEVFQGHIAGGDSAIMVAVEGAEDDAALGAADVASAGVGPNDVVIAVAASGRTPYCLGALREARARGAFLGAVTVNRETPCHALADVTVAPVVGPEVLAGSSRLKAGTAQKLVLNMISTGVMVRLGRTYGNLMVGVLATNEKLRVRARNLVITITGEQAVDAALDAAGWDVRVAVVMLSRGVDATAARALLDDVGGHLRRVLEAGA